MDRGSCSSTSKQHIFEAALSARLFPCARWCAHPDMGGEGLHDCGNVHCMLHGCGNVHWHKLHAVWPSCTACTAMPHLHGCWQYTAALEAMHRTARAVAIQQPQLTILQNASKANTSRAHFTPVGSCAAVRCQGFSALHASAVPAAAGAAQCAQPTPSGADTNTVPESTSIPRHLRTLPRPAAPLLLGSAAALGQSLACAASWLLLTPVSPAADKTLTAAALLC